MTKKRTIRSYSGLARFLADSQPTALEIAHEKLPVRTPYRYSPTIGVESHPEVGLFIRLETSHRVYEIWAVNAAECVGSAVA